MSSGDRQSNRDKYPEIAAFVDHCREVFGQQVRVISLEEIDDDSNRYAKGRSIDQGNSDRPNDKTGVAKAAREVRSSSAKNSE